MIEFEPKPKHPDAVYKLPTEPCGCEHPDHKARSIANQPNHLKRHERGYKEYENGFYENYDEGKQE